MAIASTCTVMTSMYCMITCILFLGNIKETGRDTYPMTFLRSQLINQLAIKRSASVQSGYMLFSTFGKEAQEMDPS